MNPSVKDLRFGHISQLKALIFSTTFSLFKNFLYLKYISEK